MREILEGMGIALGVIVIGAIPVAVALRTKLSRSGFDSRASAADDRQVRA